MNKLLDVLALCIVGALLIGFLIMVVSVLFKIPYALAPVVVFSIVIWALYRVRDMDTETKVDKVNIDDL